MFHIKNTKTLHLSIIVIAFSMLVLNWAHVEGRIVPQTVTQLYKESDMILVGNVTSVEIDSSGIHTFYHVKVEQYLKSQQQNDTVIVVGSGPNGGSGPPDPKFMMGDRVRLYLYKEDGMYMISVYSTNANPKCYAHELLGLGPRELIPRGENVPNSSERNCGPPFQFSSYPHTTFLPPTIQSKSGIQVSSIACNEGLQLVFKAEDNSPACVTVNTAFRLSDLGWGYISSPIISKIDLLDSKITGGTITEFNYDTQSAIIIIKIQTTSNGILTVTIPKVLTDLSPHYLFKTYTVLADGMEIDINKTATAKGPSFTIPFTNGTQEIEIIGDQVGQK